MFVKNTSFQRCADDLSFWKYKHVPGQKIRWSVRTLTFLEVTKVENCIGFWTSNKVSRFTKVLKRKFRLDNKGDTLNLRQD